MTSHRSRSIWRRILIVSLQALAAQGAARATCGSATCFIDTSGGEGLPLPATVRVDLSFRYVDQDRKLAGTREVAEVLTPKVNFEQRVLEPDHHREVRTQNSLIQLDMLYGVSRRAGVLASVTLFTAKDHEHFDDVGTPDEHFTSGDGTRGFGDLQLGAIFALVLRPKDLVQCGLKIKLPTGAWKLHDSEGAINEPTIQPRSGSIDILADLHYSHLVGPARFDWFVSGSFRANGENALGTPSEIGFSGETSRRPGPRTSASVPASGSARHPEDRPSFISSCRCPLIRRSTRANWPPVGGS